MIYDQFSARYIELYQYFYPKQSPDGGQMLKYFRHLKYFDFNTFSLICDDVEQAVKTTDFNRLNFVKHCRDYMSEKTEDYKPVRPQNYCWACGDHGWIIMNMVTDRPARVNDLNTYVKKCNCTAGRRLRDKCSMGENANFKECRQAAIENGGTYELPF